MESLSLSLSIIFTSGAVRQGKDTIMRREAENRLTLAFYRITCWENSDFWAPLSSYLFIHIYIYLLYLSIYISIYLPIYLYLFSLSPLSRALTGRAGVRCWRAKGLAVISGSTHWKVQEWARGKESWRDGRTWFSFTSRILCRNFHSKGSFRIRKWEICPRETFQYVRVS